VRPTASFLARLLFLVALGGCTRGPAPERLEQEVQARVDGLFGRTVLAVDSLRRQGSAPYRAADDGSSQIIVYYNGTFQFTETYDPSDWQGLSPTMLANALGAADEGVTGLKAGPNEPGTVLRAYGSIVYRRAGQDWQPADVIAPRPAAPAAAAVPQSRADELVRRLAELVQKAPARRGKEDEIIAEELSRALDNIRLRTGESQKAIQVAAGPEGGEYWRFLTSLLSRIGGTSAVAVAPSAGSVENAFLVDRGEARIGIVQSDVAAAAVTGAGMFSGTGPLDHLRAVASLFPEPVHIVVRADSGIENLADLAGGRLELGAVASGTRQTALTLLASAGIDLKSISMGDAATPQAALDRLGKGDVDAVIEVVSAPWRQLEIAMHSVPLRLVPLDLQTRIELASAVHGLLALTIPARTYPGQDEPVPTVAATALMVAREDVPDATVAKTLDLMYASAASGGAGVQAARLSKDRALDAVTIPLHPAAARYFAKTGRTAPAQAPEPAP
jgi:TRAP transporter TAXI family solute receptor